MIVDKNYADDELDDFLISHDVRVINTNVKSYGQALVQCADTFNGEIVALLDDDDMWFPDKISRLVNVFLEDQDIAFYHNRSIALNDDQSAMWPRAKTSHLEQVQIIDPVEGGLVGRVRRLQLYGSSNIALKKKIIENYSGFITQSFRHVDLYLLYAALASRCKLALDDSPLTVYRRHTGNTSIQRRSPQEVNQEWQDFQLIYDMLRGSTYSEPLQIFTEDYLYTKAVFFLRGWRSYDLSKREMIRFASFALRPIFKPRAALLKICFLSLISGISPRLARHIYQRDNPEIKMIRSHDMYALL